MMKFTKGMIVRIHLQDFLTFDEIEMTPKNKLNLIIGPNGAGKSTFVCAIVLGLGGKPNVIGRSPNVADYIKHGCDKAVIDLELFNPDGENYLVSRHITSNSSSWFLQGKPSTLKKIENLTQEFNIQINNLCQILPQDRVQDFAKMDQKQLLENTQKSIDQKLYDQFEQLKSVRTSIVKKEEKLAELLFKCDSEKQKNKRMEADVKCYKEKQDMLERISIIKKKMQWVLYEEKNEQRKKMQVTYEATKKKFENLKKSLQPLLQNIKEAKLEHDNSKKKLKNEIQNNNNIRQNLQDLLRNYHGSKDKIVKIKGDLKSKLDAEAQKGLAIEEFQRQIKEMESSLPQINEAEIMSNIKKADLEIDLTLRKVGQARSQERDLQDKLSAVNNALRGLQHKLTQLNSVAEKKLSLLANFEDVAEAHQWVLQNQHQFQKKVYPPIFLEVNVPNTNHARYFEHIISNKDLIAFVCEDPKDMTKLLKILRDGKNLKINAITSTPLDCSIQNKFKPRVSMSILQPLGFQKYLIDLIEGPDPILNYLCSSYNLHNIPLGSNMVEKHLDQVPSDIRAFFTESSFHRVNTSKYTGEKMQTVGEVGSARFLTFTLNKELIMACNQELLKKMEEFKGIEGQLKEMADIRQSCDVEINSARNKKRDFSQQLEYLKSSTVRLRVKRRELEKMMEQKMDPITEEAKAKLNIEACIKEIISNEAQTVKVISGYVLSKSACELMDMDQQRIGALVEKKESESKEFEAAVIAARDEAEKVKTDCMNIKLELKTIHAKAKQMTDGFDANDPGFIEKYMPLFAKLPGDKGLLQEQLHEGEAMAKCLQGSVTANAIEEYEASLKHIEHLEKEMMQLQANQTGILNKANDLLATWLPKLQELINEINEKFGAFFAAMGCAGNVQLNQGTSPMHFENYGLMIQVKFRNECELQALDSHTQSGGERALTTAVFLLSLQTISKVPFRCVDEINQGMDEINEKRVYHLIMNSISTCDTAQYFLVTPTLLPGVPYPDGTAVHCVHSTTEDGEFINWNKKRYFRHLGITTQS